MKTCGNYVAMQVVLCLWYILDVLMLFFAADSPVSNKACFKLQDKVSLKA